jgi:inner membrane protein
MDVGTQGLASLSIARAFVPRASWRAWAVIVVAGTIANVDVFSLLLGPNAFLEWHRTYVHSIVVSLIVSAALATAYILASSRRGGRVEEKTPARVPALPKAGGSPVAFFAAVFLAGLLHLALDAIQSDGTMIFWPLSRQRVALDWLPHIDPWIIAILITALFLPELTRLVSDEIGAKSKGPRGRVGAIIGLIFVAMYVGLRADLHCDAVAILQNRSYGGAAPRRVSAYPEAVSLVTWRGMVETDGALRQPLVDVSQSARFDPDNGVTLFKPEPSPILDQAQQSAAARKFLAVARFPRAEVEKTPDGYEVELRDLRYAAIGEANRKIRARIALDESGKVLSDELVWARDVSRR